MSDKSATVKIPTIPSAAPPAAVPNVSLPGTSNGEAGTLAVDSQDAFMARAILLLAGVKPEAMLINGDTKLDKSNWLAAYDDTGPIKVVGKTDAELKAIFDKGKQLHAKLAEAADKKGLKLGQPLFRFSGSYKNPTTAPDGRFVAYFPVTNMPAADQDSLQQIRQPIDDFYTAIGGTPASGGAGARDGVAIIDLVTSSPVDRVSNLMPKVEALLKGGAVEAAPAPVKYTIAKTEPKTSHAESVTPPAETNAAAAVEQKAGRKWWGGKA